MCGHNPKKFKQGNSLPSISPPILTPTSVLQVAILFAVLHSNIVGGNLTWLPHQNLYHVPVSYTPSLPKATPHWGLCENTRIPEHLPLFRVETSD